MEKLVIGSAQMEEAKKALGIGSGVRIEEVAAAAKKAMGVQAIGPNEMVILRFLGWIQWHNEHTAPYIDRLAKPKKQKPSAPVKAATKVPVAHVTSPVAEIRADVVIYCDGACSPNPGPGGWGAVVTTNGVSVECSGFDRNTTNNKMEMLAAIVPLEKITHGRSVLVISDSEYLVRGASVWISNWLKKGMLNDGRIKNPELWKRIAALNNRLNIKWQWVRGHSGNPGNERADQIATDCLRENR